VDSATTPKLVEALDDIINAGRYKIVIDISELEYMSSVGLRTLLAAQRNCKRYRGKTNNAVTSRHIFGYRA